MRKGTPRTKKATAAARDGKWAAAAAAMPARTLHGAAGVGQRLRAARVDQKVSLRELAESVDISVSTLIKMERAETFPDVAQLERVAKRLRTTPAWLAGWGAK